MDYLSEEEYTISVFNEELLSPFGQLSHKQLVSAIEQGLVIMDKDFQLGTIYGQPYLLQVINVFKQVLTISFDIAFRYDIHEDYWIPLISEFLRFKYRTALAEYAFQQTFADAFELALEGFERSLASAEGYDEFEFNKIRVASVKLGGRKQYKVLSCEKCQDYGECNRENPEDCHFINAVQNKVKKIGGENMMRVPRMSNRKLHMSIKPQALGIENMEKELDGVWNYFCLEKKTNNEVKNRARKKQKHQ